MYYHKHSQCMDGLTNEKVLFAVVFVLLAFNISLSVVTIKSTAVKHTKLSLSGVLAGWRRRLEERAAMCHMLRPCGPLGTCLRPRGHDRPRQLVCFGEV